MKKGRSSKNVVDKRNAPNNAVTRALGRYRAGASLMAQDLGLKDRAHKPSGPEHPLTKSARKYIERKKKR